MFWQHGYEATSMADLVEHLGIGRASVYATFGSKRDLYAKALERYEEIQDARILNELSRPGAVLPAVAAVVERYASECTSDRRQRGCFVTNTAAELGPHDAGAAQQVELSWRRLETLLHSALLRAQSQGELPPDRDPRALAHLLLVLMQGMRVIGKVSDDPRRVRDAADQALQLLS